MSIISRKCVIVGESGVGKTSLIECLTNSGYSRDAVQETIGVDFAVWPRYQQNRLFLWDMAGAERYRNVVRSFCRSVEVCVFVYDATDEAGSLKNIGSWLHDACRIGGAGTVLVLANKIDARRTARPVKPPPQVLAALTALDVEYLWRPVSASTAEGVEQAFEAVLHLLADRLPTPVLPPPPPATEGIAQYLPDCLGRHCTFL